MATFDSHQNELKPGDLHKEMLDAAKVGDEFDLHYLLMQWKHHNFDRKSIDCCLHGAVMANQVGSVRQLMDYGAKLDAVAVGYDEEEVVSIDVWKTLLDHGWNVNSYDLDGDPIIFNFLSDQNIDPILTLFLSRGASLEARSRIGLNALSYTAGYKPVPVLRALLEHARRRGGDTLTRSNALHEAASNRHEDRTAALALLVDEMGVDVNALSAYGWRPPRYNRAECRPLHRALRSGRREHVRFLLERGASVTERNADGLDARGFAKYVGCEKGWKALEEWFAEKGLVVPGEGQESEKGVAKGE